MDIRYFRHFLAVAEELHFGRAANRLNMEQAPLSQSIKRLETFLGVTLFDRSPRGGTKLTGAGQILKGEAEKAVSQFDRAISMTRRFAGSSLEPIRVGFVTAGVLDVLPNAVKSFSSRFPEIRVQLQEGSTSDMLAAVDADRIELALVHPIDNPPAGVVLEEIRRDRTMVALPQSHPFAGRKQIALKDLADEPLVFFPRTASPDLHKRFMSYFQEQGVTPQIEQEARLTPTILLLVAAGLGYGLVQESARKLPFPNIVFLPLADLPFELHWSLSLAWKPRVAAKPVQDFAATIKRISGA